jgi:hypothetical protein
MLLKFFKGFHGLIETTKPLSRSHWNRGIGFCGLIETMEEASVVSLRPLKPTITNDYLEFLSDFEAMCESTLAHESGL